MENMQNDVRVFRVRFLTLKNNLTDTCIADTQSARAHQQLLDEQVVGINKTIADVSNSYSSESNSKGETPRL